MDWWMIFVQFLGIVAMIIAFLSLQYRSNKNYLLMQCISMVLFSTHFVLLGSMGGAFMNLIGALRSIVFYNKSFRGKTWSFVLLESLTIISIAACIIFFKESPWLSILIFVANSTNTFSVWKGDGKIIRFATLFVQAPMWIIYNIFAFSIAGIISETFNIISSVVALFRFRKIGFEQN